MQKSEGNFFIMNNDIFNLHLDPYEFSVYSYLMRCRNKEYKCWPSYKAIGRILGISTETVRTKIDSLVQKHLIQKEHTSSITKFGNRRRANNMYTILPFSVAWDYAFRFDKGS